MRTTRHTLAVVAIILGIYLVWVGLAMIEEFYAGLGILIAGAGPLIGIGLALRIWPSNPGEERQKLLNISNAILKPVVFILTVILFTGVGFGVGFLVSPGHIYEIFLHPYIYIGFFGGIALGVSVAILILRWWKKKK